MVDFSNLKALDVNEETLAEFVFEEIPGSPSLWLAPATDDNRMFFAARLKMSGERAEKMAEESKKRTRKSRAAEKIQITPEDFDEDRESDRRLLSECCIKKWGVAPRDVHGASPEFSVANCYDFLAALPNYMFDRLRGFASKTYNFIPKVDDNFQPLTDSEIEALGNS